MKFTRFFKLTLFFFVFFVVGCNDEPNPVGTDIIKNEDYGTVKVATFYATGHSSFYDKLFATYTDRAMLGRYKSYEAWMCLLFGNWPDSLLGAQITSARIQLKSVYQFGETNGTVSFDVYSANNSTFGDSLTCDSLVDNIGNYYYDPTSILIQPVYRDTGTIFFNIDPSVVQGWFVSNVDTVSMNMGIILRPLNTNAIEGFYTYNGSDTAIVPKLYVDYIDTNGIAGSYSHQISYSRYVAKVENLINDDNLIYVQNGISYRGLVAFDSIPLQLPVSINNAMLQIELDKAASSSHEIPFETDSLLAFSCNADGAVVGFYYGVSKSIEDSSGSHFYQFDVTAAFRYWMGKTTPPRLGLSGYSELMNFDLFVLAGTGAKRPKITVTYSIKQ